MAVNDQRRAVNGHAHALRAEINKKKKRKMEEEEERESILKKDSKDE